MFYNLSKTIPVSNPKRNDYELPVQDGLAITPAQMMELTQKGIPVSARTLGAQFYDGALSNDFDVDIVYKRGVDIAEVDAFQYQSKERVRTGLKKAFDGLTTNTITK